MSFIMKYHNLTFPEALKELAQKYDIVLPEQTLSFRDEEKAKKRAALFEANKKAAALFHQYLLASNNGEAARQYLKKRGIPIDTINNFNLGYAPDNWNFLCDELKKAGVQLDDATDAGLVVRKEKGGHYDRFRKRIVCPIYNTRGQVVAFGGRILGEGQPKYLNSPESSIFDKSSNLFGLYQNKAKIREKKQCIVVEGNFDLLSLVAGGIENVVAPLGTALTKHHVRSIKGYADEIILLFDGDRAGINAAMRTVPIFLAEQVNGRIAILPPKHDPDTYIKEQGAAGLLAVINKALPLSEFVFAHFAKIYGMTLEGKNRIVAELRPIIEAIGDQTQRQLFIAHFSSKIGLSAEQLLNEKGQKQNVSSISAGQQKAAPNRTKVPLKQRLLLEFLLIYPEYLSRFLEAGLEELIDNETGFAILHQLKKVCAENPAATADDILISLDGPEKSFISEMLITAPSYDEEERETMAAEKISWLEKISLKNKMEELTGLIHEAQQARNVARCMELIAQKSEMEKRIASQK